MGKVARILNGSRRRGLRINGNVPPLPTTSPCQAIPRPPGAPRVGLALAIDVVTATRLMSGQIILHVT
jgi:hypothetical protein